MTHEEAIKANKIYARQVCLYDGRKCEVIECGEDGVLIIDTLNAGAGFVDANDCFLVPWSEVSPA